MSRKEILISVDVETDGPCPLMNSMLSLGAVPFDDKGVYTNFGFEINLKPLLSAKPDPDTLAWWAKQPEAYKLVTQNQVPITQAMNQFVDWVGTVATHFDTQPTFAAFPTGFDFTWVYVYCHYFAGRCPFGFQAWDGKTAASILTKQPYRGSSKKNLPKEWTRGLSHPHTALEDAAGQAWMFQRMLQSC